MSNESQDPRDHQDPINIPISEGLRMGVRRPRFRHDASPKFTAYVLLFLVGIIFAAVFLSNW